MAACDPQAATVNSNKRFGINYNKVFAYGKKNILFYLLHSAARFQQLTKASCTVQQAFFQIFLQEAVFSEPKKWNIWYSAGCGSRFNAFDGFLHRAARF